MKGGVGARVMLAALCGAVLGAVPVSAWACPACIGKNEALPPALKLVGLFLLVPFVLFGIALLVVRRLNRAQ